jgi:Co/Zn/Cd efflux system component
MHYSYCYQLNDEFEDLALGLDSALLLYHTPWKSGLDICVMYIISKCITDSAWTPLRSLIHIGVCSLDTSPKFDA